MPGISLHQRIGSNARPHPHKSLFVTALPIMLAMASLFVLSGCSSPLAGIARPTATPTAQQILTHAQNAKVTDETFTMTMQTSSQGTPSATGSVTATATGKATTNPQRIALSMSMTVTDTTIACD